MTSLSTSKLDPRKAESLANHWHFSTETAFRIPELLDDLRHDLRRSRLNFLHGIVPSETEQPIHLEFVRRVLTGSDEETNLANLSDPDKKLFGDAESRLCYQFTGSYHFGQFRRDSRDHGGLGSDCGQPLTDAFALAKGLFDAIKCSSSLKSAWDTAADAFCAAYKGTTTANVLECLKQQAERLDQIEHHFEDKFRFLSLLYVFYSRFSHVGEAAGTVSNAHFEPDEGDSFRSGRPDTLAYLLVSSEGKDEVLLRIHEDGCVSENILAQNYDRPTTMWFPDKHTPDENQNAKIRELFAELWTLFNERLAGRRYDLVIPVYEMDDISRLPSHHKLVVKGAFLGWLFVRVELETVQSIFGARSGGSFDETFSSIAAAGGTVAAGAADEIKAIRFALNRFSEMYLLGEMEWLLEQDWDARDAAEFTTTHFHHCGAWIGDSTDKLPDEFLHDDYFAFCRKNNFDGALERVDPHGAPSNTITHLVVDVGRHFAFSRNGDGPIILIGLRKRPDTALPVVPRDCLDYGAWVAKNIGQVYAAAKLREAERMAGRTANQRNHSFMMAHELRKLTAVIREGNSPFAYDTLRRQLYNLSIKAEGDTDAANESTSMANSFPLCYHPDISTLGDLLTSALKFACHMQFLKKLVERDTSELKQSNLKERAESDSEEWMETLLLDPSLSHYGLNAFFPRKLGKFVIRMILTAASNYFKHAKDRPLTLSVSTIPNGTDFQLKFSNTCREEPGALNGTYDVLHYDLESLLAAARAERRKRFAIPDEEVVSLLRFSKDEAISCFVTAIPLPKGFLVINV